MLRNFKRIDSAVAGVAVCSLSSAAIVGLMVSGFGVGDDWGDGQRHWFILISLALLAGAAVIGWLARQLTKANNSKETLIRRLENTSGQKQKLHNQLRDLELAKQLSQRSRKNTEAIIYSIGDAVVVIDESDRITMANQSAGQLLGFDHEQLRDRVIDDIACCSEEDPGREQFVRFLKQSRRNQSLGTRREIEFVRDDQRHIYNCIISCVHDQREKVCGVVAVLHDITREKEISAMKNDFVSHVSHELKTPLSSITAYSEMLADGEAEDEQTRKEFYCVIQTQAQRLNRLIEDILNVSRIESGLIKVQKKPVSLTILIEEQLSMIRSFAAEKNIEVISQQPIVFDQVEVDKDMLSQVIVNLLSNAVKYTPSGGQVRITSEVDEHKNVVQVRVTDTGVGIPKDDLEHVFEKFYRVKKNSSQAKGTGLGLNLVKQIVEKIHNGRVFVTSQPGTGSTFTFELPLAKACEVVNG